MDAQQLFSEFLASDHGAQASQALAAQGISADDAQQMLSHAVDVTHAHVEEQAGASVEHTGRNFFAAFAAGLVRGDGFFHSLVEGGEGILTGKVTAALAERMGIDPSTASTVAAAATPYIAAFLKEKLA
ncbi:hypothetical protein H3H37_03650 [Duganella sp. LX20W]|uniref:DUF937 domain-containing protein n=1 Tax=Rugamonas brunnea TaxID=2758569 RepID=A0A7W2EPI7_9BURK|nr:hypothetical protein [Rugamonas brunnea]MBA5636140.1 hypothetical protein [Rugamonas brunnea]